MIADIAESRDLAEEIAAKVANAAERVKAAITPKADEDSDRPRPANFRE
jgi:hypothetical protein